MTNIETAQAMYEAFGRGDVPGIMAHMADDIAFDDWTGNSAVDNGNLDYMTPRTGKTGAAAFFEALQGVEFLDFRVINLMAGGNQVAATVALETRVKKTGKGVRDDMIHLWTFDAQGRATRFLHYLDTAKHIAANT